MTRSTITRKGHTAPASFESVGLVVLLVGWLRAATLVGGLRCKVSSESAYKFEDNKPVVLKGTCFGTSHPRLQPTPERSALNRFGRLRGIESFIWTSHPDRRPWVRDHHGTGQAGCLCIARMVRRCQGRWLP